MGADGWSAIRTGSSACAAVSGTHWCAENAATQREDSDRNPDGGRAVCRGRGVCVLDRRAGAASLSPLPRDFALEYFHRYLRWGDAAKQDADLGQILGNGCWRLSYADFDDAISILEDLAG